VPVIDRGPFRRGVAWDLTAAAANKLGFRTSGRLRSAP
jgi:rare lipoprotein A (peptidoglycan hydrolase)